MKKFSKRLLSILTALAMIYTIFLSPVSEIVGFAGESVKAGASGYNVNSAVSYARQYALSYNPSYSNYNSIGGDCANFVSQCLYAGGLQMDSSWYWYSYDNHSSSWTYVPSMVTYFSNAGYTVIHNATSADIKPGNPVFYKSGSSYAHTAICVGYSSDGTPLVAAHNNDRLDVNWMLGGYSYWDGFATVLITDSTINDDLVPDPDYAAVVPFNAYLLSDETVYPYNSDCSTVMSGAEIWGSDECTIHEVYTNGWCKVEYPISSGTKTAYLPLSYFVKNPSLKLSIFFKQQSNHSAYTRSNKSTSYGTMSKGDTCYIVGSEGNTTQYFYPGGVKYKLGWADFDCPVYISRWISESADMNDTKLSEGKTGNRYYFWFGLYHNDTDVLIDEVTNILPITAELEVFKPDGTSLYSTTYNNSYCNWIACTLNTAGTYTFEVTLSGGLTGTYTKTFEVKDASCSHSYTSSITTPPTCTEDGVRTYTCSKCNDSYTETIEATGHVITSELVEFCTGNSYIVYECDNCTYWEAVPIEPAGHNYTSKVTKVATCIATGIRTYTCERCNDSYTETIAKTSHSYSSSYTVDKQATCSAEGSKSRHCTTSGCTAKTDVTAIPKTSHSYTSKVTKAATCIATGIRTYTCSACGDSYTETIAKTSHSYSSSYTVDKAATCSAEGSKSRHCTTSGCTAKTDVTAIPKTGHSYTSKVTKAATCIATGIRTYTCSACGDSYTETIAKTSHSYSSSYTVDKAATCSAEGSKSRHCTTSGCTAKTDVTAIPKTGHSYTNKVVAPTYFAQGYTRHTCSVCSYSYNDTYTDKKILSTVSGFTSPSKSTTAIRLSWTKNSNASGYIVEQFNGSSWEQIATITDKATVTYKVTGLTPGTAYKFRVKAYVSSGSSKAYSKYTSTLTANTMMTAVKGFTSPSKSTSAIRLNWTKNANADGYVIEQFNGTSWVQIADITDSATITYKVTGLKSGTAYKFRMKAYSVTKYGDTIYGDKTETLTANTQASAVTGLALKSRSASALRLTWTKNTAVDGYIIEQKIDGKWVQIADIDSYATTEYKVTGLSASTKYSFRMKAYAITKYGDKTYSGYTSTLSKTTSPANVTGLKIGGRAGTALRLNWNKNTSADGYIIEQYKGGKWTQIAEITDNATTTYRVAGLEASTQYKFRVKAYNMVGSTALYSNYTATLAAYTNPYSVSNLAITGMSRSALRLGWDVNTSADGYIVEQYIDGKWTRIARIAGNETTTFRVDGLTSGTTYKFRVATYNIEDNVAYYSAYVTVNGRTTE